jgi:L-malate glycosyltransferase
MSDYKKKISVLHIENSIAFTGAFKSLLNFCDYSKDRIYSVVVIKKGSSCKKILENHGIKVYELPFIELSKKPLHLLFYFPALILNALRIKEIANKEKINVLHNNDLYNMSLFIAKYFFDLRKPLIVHVRMMPASFPSLFYKFWRFINLRYSNKLIAVSRAVKKAYNNPEKMEVIYDVDYSPEIHPQYEINLDKTRQFKFIYLANYIYGKGQDCALNAFEILVKKNPGVTLTFVGGDMGMGKNIQYKNKLKKQVIKRQLTEKIFFENFTQDIELKLKMYDASLNFSYSESFSRVAYESLRYGVPFISSDCGGPAELFVNGESGFLVKNKSVDEMAEAMYQLSTDVELRKKFSMNSRKYIKEIINGQSDYNLLEELMLEMYSKKKI